MRIEIVRRKALFLALAIAAVFVAQGMSYGQTDPATAPRAVIDRFSADAGTLMVRDDTNGLPDAGEPIDFDQPPFITQGLGPNGEIVQYYNFDAQSTTPAPIYVLFHEGESSPVEGQIFVVDAIPGDPGYSDFWNVMAVTVPADYVANTTTSLAEIQEAGYPMEATDMIVNCPIVPEGSTAILRLGGADNSLHMGWYRGEVVTYFAFEEHPLTLDAGGNVPLSPIYVSFNINPDQEGGGPASGFATEPGTSQTHNVVATLPSDAAYSPLWAVNVYDNADFDSVSDLASAQQTNILGPGPTVNCPIVSVETDMEGEDVFFMALDRGLNMISLPLMPLTPYTASRLAEETDATVVIRFDAVSQRFVGFTADSGEEGFLIEGGQGYIVNVREARQVAFVGTAWRNSPAAPGVSPVDTRRDAWAFVVTGNAQNADIGREYTMRVKNTRTGAVAMDAISSENRRFAATWADLSRRPVIEVGDTLEIALLDERGNIVSGPFERRVNVTDIRQAYLSLPLTVGDVRPKTMLLGQNFPNPFNPETWVPYQLNIASEVTIQIYDAFGSSVRTLHLGLKSRGFYTTRDTAAYWDGRNRSGERVSSGVYFYTLHAGDFTATRKMIVVK